jgi:hypothetical protein
MYYTEQDPFTGEKLTVVKGDAERNRQKSIAQKPMVAGPRKRGR